MLSSMVEDTSFNFDLYFASLLISATLQCVAILEFCRHEILVL